MRRLILLMIYCIWSVSFSTVRANEVVSCIKCADLKFPELEQFLKDRIIPIYKSNNGNKDYDRIYVTFNYFDSENVPKIVNVTVYVNDRYDISQKSIRKNYYYGSIIDGTRIVIETKPQNPYVRIYNNRRMCFKAEDFPGNSDNCCMWSFQISESKLKYLGMINWGLSWLEDLRKEDYIPDYRPFKRVENHDTALIPTGNFSFEIPDSIIINSR